jgi:hypothetical protein
MERAFGRELGSVRLHEGALAERSAEAINAVAYTFGNRIVFGAGAFAPTTAAGRRLLAHEIAHVVQQAAPNGVSGGSIELGRVDDPQERDAERVAARVAAGRPAGALSRRDSPVLRRVVSIPDDQVSFAVTTRPTAIPAVINTPNAEFNSTEIHMLGGAGIAGAPGDNCIGHRFGFLQTEWVETNRAYYRGQRDADGSVLVRRDRPPARTAGACQDTSTAGQVFTEDPGETASAPCNSSLAVESIDDPSDDFPLVEHNATTGKDNFLREAQLEFLFTTVFTVRRPDGTFQHLRSVYWNVRWEHRFTLNNFAAPGDAASWAVATLGGTGAATGGIIRGAPADPRTPTFTTVHGDNCNAVSDKAGTNPVRTERGTW